MNKSTHLCTITTIVINVAIALQRRKQLARLTEALQEDQRQQEEREEEVDTGTVSRATGRTRPIRHESNSIICTIL